FLAICRSGSALAISPGTLRLPPVRQAVLSQEQLILLVFLLFSSFERPLQCHDCLRPPPVDGQNFFLPTNAADVAGFAFLLRKMQVRYAEPLRLVGSIGTVQAKEQENSLQRESILVEDGRLFYAPSRDRGRCPLHVLIQFSRHSLDKVEI